MIWYENSRTSEILKQTKTNGEKKQTTLKNTEKLNDEQTILKDGKQNTQPTYACHSFFVSYVNIVVYAVLL